MYEVHVTSYYRLIMATHFISKNNPKTVSPKNIITSLYKIMLSIQRIKYLVKNNVNVLNYVIIFQKHENRDQVKSNIL